MTRGRQYGTPPEGPEIDEIVWAIGPPPKRRGGAMKQLIIEGDIQTFGRVLLGCCVQCCVFSSYLTVNTQSAVSIHSVANSKHVKH